MSYIILKSREKEYHKKVLWAGLESLVKYEKAILQFAAEMPYLPLSREEIVSDLIIDRLPRFVENFRGAAVEVLVELLKTDITAASSKAKYILNVNTLVANARTVSEKYKLSRTPGNLAAIDEVEKQLQYLKHLSFLSKVEKQWLSYLRSCVRRTKIKYLQQLRGTIEGRLTHSADPTNGLQEHSHNGRTRPLTEHSLFEVMDLLNSCSLTPDEQNAILWAVIYELPFPTIGVRLGCSRATAARLYQSGMVKFQQEATETLRF